ncbi:MAG: ribosome-associated translation inhibitor RaiA [Candidatus Spechtbacterales bacterium]|nr:ribosome-associated translation inhibitor RaiA [Candidatus Spechtbacterales bacterium]
MQINIKTKNIELTDPLREYIEQKVGELEKLISKVGEEPQKPGEHDTVMVDVEVARTTNHHKKGDDIMRAEINMRVPGVKNILRVESEQWDARVAIDEAKDDMQRQLRKYKGKKRAKKQKGRRKFKDLLHLSKLARKDDEQE